jgi:hypothetical protein
VYYTVMHTPFPGKGTSQTWHHNTLGPVERRDYPPYVIVQFGFRRTRQLDIGARAMVQPR